jgi:hypothetical protein
MLNLPIGTIIAWENTSIPSGWAICDGTGGTPDLRDKFVMGAAEDGDVRTTGGANTHLHTNANTSTRATHNHGGSKSVSMGSGSSADSTVGTGLTVASPGHTHSGSVAITGADSHAHTVGDTGSTSTLPRYITRAFIRRMS